MSDYHAPLDDMRFTLSAIAGLDELTKLAPFEDATPDLVAAVLEEAGKLASEVIAPLNHSGDQEKVKLENGVVRTPEGFKDAYRQFVEGGWNALPFDPEYGGQGLPWAVAAAVTEMINAANMSWALCPLLTQGAVELLQSYGTEEQKALYLPKIVSGEWAGTMNLTEPQAGTDVGAAKTKAEPQGDGSYKITGQKIYITYGEHDLTENIIHMVLARLPDAPAGTKGISLFLVPKFLVDADGGLGRHNDLRCVSLEKKLGIHASPTCVMAYGDDGGATGYLVGKENRGMEAMFTMMNNARLAVGIQGVAIAERAYQQALAYAKDRTQSRAVTGSDGPVRIIEHPDVRRMLLTMRAYAEAGRAMAYTTLAALDRAKHESDEGERTRLQQSVVDLLTPVVKAWCTDKGVEAASLGIQVHGGMGFIEETGAAQHYRDARILPIYEGTNGVQALDLIGRKILRLKGEPAKALAGEIAETVQALEDGENEMLAGLGAQLGSALVCFEAATEWLLEAGERDMAEAAAGATPYLELLGTLAGGWLLAKGALAADKELSAGGGNAAFLTDKIRVALFYGASILPAAAADAEAAIQGAAATLEGDLAAFAD